MKDFTEESRVEFVGLHDLEAFDKSNAIDTANRSFEKIKKITKHETRLVIHIKIHEVEGKRKKWSIHSKLFVPGTFLESSHVEWDLMAALQKSLSVLEKEVIKKLKK